MNANMDDLCSPLLVNFLLGLFLLGLFLFGLLSWTMSNDYALLMRHKWITNHVINRVELVREWFAYDYGAFVLIRIVNASNWI